MFKYIVIVTISFVAGYSLSYHQHSIISESEVITTPIVRPVDMSYDDVITELNCYDTAIPSLDITHSSGDSFLLSAKLCEREWIKHTTIKLPHKEYNNLITGGVVAGKRLGGYTSYYRLFGRVGIGGGVVVTDRIQFNLGGALLW